MSDSFSPPKQLTYIKYEVTSIIMNENVAYRLNAVWVETLKTRHGIHWCQDIRIYRHKPCISIFMPKIKWHSLKCTNQWASSTKYVDKTKSLKLHKITYLLKTADKNWVSNKHCYTVQETWDKQKQNCTYLLVACYRGGMQMAM